MRYVLHADPNAQLAPLIWRVQHRTAAFAFFAATLRKAGTAAPSASCGPQERANERAQGFVPFSQEILGSKFAEGPV